MTLLERLRKQLADLQKRAADKTAEINDDTAEDAVREIESDHEKILAEIADVRAKIKDAEDAERAAADDDIDQRLSEVSEQARNAAESARQAAESAITEERKRGAEINELAMRHGVEDLAPKHIADGTSVRDFKDVVLTELEKRTSGGEGASLTGSGAVVGEEASEKRAAAVESAILHRANPSQFKLENGGEEYRGMSLMDLARDSLEVQGIRTRGMDRQEIAAQALTRNGGYHGTADFPTILGNVVNRTLRAAYEAAPQTFRPLVREVSVSDFKMVTRAQLGEAPMLEEVNEHGEFKRGTLGEGGESYKIGTFGKIIGITRQAIINDDMNAFDRIPQGFGQQAAQLESDVVWAQILGNYKMSDGKDMFHNDRKNLGTGAAFGVTPISKARSAMAKQTGLDGKTVLNITPSFVIVPVEMETTAEQVLRQTHYPTKASDNTATESMRKLQVISEPRLDVGIARYNIAGNTNAYYFAASPSAIDTIELAYLEGQRGVYTETRAGFDVDGVEVKARLDVGAKTIEAKAFHKNPGV